MRKFPVTSKNGVEYEVRVFRESTFGWAGVDVYEQRKGVFGTRMKRIAGSTSSWCYYTEEQWGSDYILMAKHEVEKYENNNAEKLRLAIEEAEGIEAFTEWNGKC